MIANLSVKLGHEVVEVELEVPPHRGVRCSGVRKKSTPGAGPHKCRATCSSPRAFPVQVSVSRPYSERTASYGAGPLCD